MRYRIDLGKTSMTKEEIKIAKEVIEEYYDKPSQYEDLQNFILSAEGIEDIDYVYRIVIRLVAEGVKSITKDIPTFEEKTKVTLMNYYDINSLYVEVLDESLYSDLKQLKRKLNKIEQLIINKLFEA